jgi:hypothetical protein
MRHKSIIAKQTEQLNCRAHAKIIGRSQEVKNMNKILAVLMAIALVLPAFVGFAYFAKAAPNYDLNGDGHVDVLDVILLSHHFGEAWAPGDFNVDGFVNVLDFILLATHLS